MTSTTECAPALTRRQLRELERQAEAAAAREAVHTEAIAEPELQAELSASRDSASFLPEEHASVDVRPYPSRRELRRIRELAEAETEEIPEVPNPAAAPSTATAPAHQIALPTRREVREAATQFASRRELRPEPRAGSRRSPHSMPRAALVGSLGLATIAGPVTGLAAASGSATSPANLATEVAVSEKVAGAAANAQLNGEIPSAPALAKEPLARVVANDISSRSLKRTVVSQCRPITQSATGFSDANTVVVGPLVRPMASGTYRDTSAYGARWGSFHPGTDMAAPVGTPLYAVADGVVVHAGGGRDGRSGQLIIIKSKVNGRDVWFWYGHMYPSGVHVREGQKVRAGQQIGGVGNSGFSTGPHLHFEVHVGTWDNHVSPYGWLRANSAVFPGQC